MVTKEFLPFLKTPKNPYYYGSKKSTRQRRLNDGPVWPCTGALNSCTAANHRESISACRRDDLGVATVNVTRKRRITPVRSIPAPPCAPVESRNNNLRRVRPVRPLDEAVLTTWNTPPDTAVSEACQNSGAEASSESAKDRQRIGNRHMKRDVARFRLVQIGWWEPPHSCGGARLSSRAARVGLFSSGFSRGVLKPGLKPDGSKRDSFRDAEAGGSHRQQPTRFRFAAR